MLSSLVREGSELRVQAEKMGAAGCFNKNRMIQYADELIAMIKDVAYQRGHRREIPRVPLAALRGCSRITSRPLGRPSGQADGLSGIRAICA